jgi:hypothetical protein
MRRFVLNLVTVLLVVVMGVPSMAAAAFAETETGLLIQAPKAAKVGEKVVIQVADEAGEAVDEASIYARESATVSVSIAEKASVATTVNSNLVPLYLGVTDEKGQLIYVFSAPNDYQLEARKEGYKLGIARIVVEAPTIIAPQPYVLSATSVTTATPQATVPSTTPTPIVGPTIVVPSGTQVVTVTPPASASSATPAAHQPVLVEVKKDAEGRTTIVAPVPTSSLANPVAPSQTAEIEVKVKELEPVEVKVQEAKLIAVTASVAQEIKILPQDLLPILPTPQVVEEVQLTAAGGKAVYETSGFIEGKLLEVIPVKVKVTTIVDTQTGEVIAEKLPGWYGLVRPQLYVSSYKLEAGEK